MVYSMAPSGPFDVARTIINPRRACARVTVLVIEAIYLATTVYLAQQSII